MYDALLDSLEEEPISRADETLDLGEDPVGVIDVEEDDLDRAVLDDDEERDPELDLAADDLLAGVEDESWSDDPVRMYLTQMGEIPLLTRQQEVALVIGVNGAGHSAAGVHQVHLRARDRAPCRVSHHPAQRRSGSGRGSRGI